MKDNQTYRIKEIVKPSIYAMDIVHSLWNNHDVYLINNSDCTQIVLKNNDDEVVSKIDIAAEELPYIIDINSFPDLVDGSKIMFLDTNDDEIR